MKVFVTILIITGTLLPSACVSDGGDRTRTGRTEQDVSADNAMSYNQLLFNRLVYNRFSFNRLVYNRLTANRLVYNSLDQLEQSAAGRELLLYIARCALPQGDVLVTEYSGVDYQFPGLLGLAPEWVDRSLTRAEERMVSACLIAHVNAFGVTVQVSLRAPGALPVEDAERSEFLVYEGTFFGNVFGAELRTYGCIGDVPDIASAHSPDRALRVCADPGDTCEVVSVGYCRDVCETRTPGQGWQDCWADGRRYAETVSVYLRAPNLDGNNAVCGAGERCHLAVNDGDGILDCSGADHCRAVCRQGATCTLDGTDAANFEARVLRTSLAEVNCHEADECKAVCRGNSVCEIDCKDADTCARVACRQGAQCLLDCTGARDCGFARCDGDVRVCPGDVVVCNRPCP